MGKVDAQVAVNLKPGVKTEILGACAKAVEEVFNLDILPAAVEASPVRTGTNRRSIDTEVTQPSPTEIRATLYTQSGYGGYLELGTARMVARPYLYPAFDRFSGKIAKLCRTKISSLRKK